MPELRTTMTYRTFRVWPNAALVATLLAVFVAGPGCDDSKNHLEPYSEPLTAKQKGERAMDKASKTTEDAALLALFQEARTEFELALKEEPDKGDEIYPLLATAKAGLAGLAFYKVLLDGVANGNVDPRSLATGVLPSDPTQTQIDLLNGAIANLRQMTAERQGTGIKFQTVFYSVLAIRMTVQLVQNTASSITEISVDNASAIINNLDAIIESGLQGEHKEQFQQIKDELDSHGDPNATSAEKIAAYCTANPTAQFCTGS